MPSDGGAGQRGRDDMAAAEPPLQRRRLSEPPGADGSDAGTTKVPTLTLANGVEIPRVGFGTAYFKDGVRTPEKVYSVLPAALDVGYRHLDSASMYGSERHVGAVLGRYFMDGRLTRDEVFMTTKVGHPPTKDFPDAQTHWIYDPNLSAFDGLVKEFMQCLDRLGLGYVDLLLLHWPGVFDAPRRFLPDWVVPRPSPEEARRKRAEMWAAMEHLYERKLARAIGVSNFTRQHLEHLLPTCKVKPMMNQVEVHPYLMQADLVDYCHERGIHITAYSPLAGGKVKVVEDERLVQLAERKGVSPSQLILAWLVQRDIVVIPKSSNRERMAQNLRVSDVVLSPEEMQFMAGLDRGLHTCVVDPTTIP